MIAFQFLHRMWTFKLLFLCVLTLLNDTFCYDSESFESNRVEVTPFYDTIIYNDIADIINDFENNANTPYDTLLNSESERDDNIEDLLSEYQQYLDKAHKQRITYLEKKTKNKVPPLRRDKYPKMKATSGTKYNGIYNSNNYYNPHTLKFSQTSFNNPLDLFIPFNSKGRFIDKVELTTVVPKINHEKMGLFDKMIFNEKNLFNIPTIWHKPTIETTKSSCYCKNNQIPCECNCEKCIMPLETPPRNHVSYSPYERKFVLPSLFNENFGKEHFIEDIGDVSDNTLNIRVKVDLQLPRTQEVIGKYFKLYNYDKTLERDDYNSKEFSSAINVPLPYFNFPIPMDVFDYKKTLKYTQHDKTPIHKITIHKKKKAKTNNNNNKRHRKKVISFHNIKPEPQQVFLNNFADKNISDSIIKDNFTNVMLHSNSELNLIQNSLNHTINNKTVDIFNKTQVGESIYVMVNISSSNDNGTDDNHKLENSIETDYIKTVPNETTKLPINMREKRNVDNETKYTSANQNSNVKAMNSNPPKFNANITKGNNNSKKSEKGIFTDTELLYWPNNENHNYTHSKNITSIILENEHKKTKLNMSKETIRHDHTRALEEAIFGEVDWDNIDAVAPAFMSFVGKYIRGILTFCSQSVCHSMNCASKRCIHRVCLPVERLNNREHCIGSDKTDSIASMESIMDLPSNIAFEIVDILQNKMLGKLFGKATLCINSKCITFIASKKNFIKLRCFIKELNTIGHCSNTKNVKII